MTTNQLSTAARVFSVSVEHESGALAVISSDGADLRLDAFVDGVPAVSATLGIAWGGETLGPGSVLVGESARTVREKYTAYVGKASGPRSVHHEEATFAFLTPSGREWLLFVRAAADGFAFRYQIWPQGVVENVIGDELTRVELAPEGRLWTLDYHTWYETVRFGVDTAEIAAGEYGLPTLVDQRNGVWVLLSEADIDGNSSGVHLVRDDSDATGVLRVVAGDVPLAVGPGHQTPWRVIIAGSLGDVVASNLVDDLAPAGDPSIPVVAKPGRASWGWWADHNSGSSLDRQKELVDYAADQGWEYLLVDYGWEPTWMPELVAYASQRGVQVHVWSLWSDLNGPVNLRKLALWKSWGVVGVKIDCMESESRDRYRWYDSVMAEAERVGLMLNFHGSVIPRGWTRTHPNVVSYEAIRGAEAYIYHGAPLTAAHNLIQPFTRNVVGPMDFTPVTFSAPGRTTSDGHELALSVAFEAGIQHFADDPAEYVSRPLAQRFMATLPVAWHETRLLEGHPDTHAVIARRFDDTWFVAALGNGDGRTVRLDPSRLLAEYTGWLVNDAADGGLADQSFATGDGVIEVPLAANGGFVAVLAPPTAMIAPAPPRGTRRAVVVEPRRALAAPGDGVVLTTEADADLVAAPGWDVEPLGAGTWRVRPPRDAAPGTAGVFAAVRPDPSGVAVIGHATVFVPLGPGRRSLAGMPFAHAHSSQGAVGRNRSNGNGPNGAHVMRVAGQHYPHGLGVTDDSMIEFFLGGQGGTLTTAVGIDDEVPHGSAIVSVLLDGVTVEQHTVRAGEEPRTLVVDLASAAVVELRTTPDPAAARGGHVDWIDAYITRGV